MGVKTYLKYDKKLGGVVCLSGIFAEALIDWENCNLEEFFFWHQGPIIRASMALFYNRASLALVAQTAPGIHEIKNDVNGLFN